MRTTFLTFLLLFVLALSNASAQTARVQIIHNAPTPTVDIYAGTAKLLDDFAYRTATPYIDVPAGVSIPLGIALGNSQSSADALATIPVQLEAGKTYVVVATGIVGGNPGFELKLFDMGLEATTDPNNVGILFFHGSPDAPTVDVLTGGAPIINNASYGDFQGYLQVPAASYELSITPGNDNNTVVAKYTADLSFWKGRTAVIFASGFFSGAGPKFEPWVALSSGGTFPLPALQTPPDPTPTTARIQVVHNAPSPTVDIYAGSAILLNDFAYRTATPYIDVPAGVSIPLGIALGNSQSSADALATIPVQFEAGKRYVVVATGIVGGNPGFELRVFDQGLENTTDPNNVGILFFHGSPDAPTVDVLTGGAPIINDASYRDFQGYLQVPAASYELSVTPGNDNNTVVARYQADLSFWKGRTALIFASGFFSGANPSFEPWVALSNGATFPLQTLQGPPTPAPTNARVQIIHNAPTPTVDIYGGTALLVNDFAFRTATPYIDVPASVSIPLGIALGNSQSSADALATIPVQFEAGKRYVVVATGIVGGNPGFELRVFDQGLENTTDPNNVGILFFHGSPDAPTVDVLTGGAPIINDASYRDFQGYLQVPAASYELSVTPGNDNNTVVAKYGADLSFWKGRTAVIFASGFFSGANPSFEPWVALSNGATFPLPLIPNLQDPQDEVLLRGSAARAFGETRVYPNPSSGRVNIAMELPENTDVQVLLTNKLGQLVYEQNFGLLPRGEHILELDLDGGLASDNYFLTLRSAGALQTTLLSVQR